jgi:hypothetical protein
MVDGSGDVRSPSSGMGEVTSYNPLCLEHGFAVV